MPLLCPSFIDSDMHKSIIHGAGEEIHFLSIMLFSEHFKGCILVFEYYYFLSQTNSNAKNAFAIALKEYQQSETQAIVSNALQDAIKKHGDDHDTLINAITDIILTNQMCMSFKLLVWASEQLMIHISKKICVNNNLHTLMYCFMMCLPP